MRIAFELASDADSKLAACVWNLLFHMHSMGSKIIPGMPVCYKAEGCEIKPWSCHSKITKRNLENAGQAEKSNGAKWSALMEDFLEKCTLIRIMRIMIEKLFPLCRTRHRRDIGFNTAEEIERAGLFISTCDREGALSWGNKHKCACVRVGGHRVREALKKKKKKNTAMALFWFLRSQRNDSFSSGCAGLLVMDAQERSLTFPRRVSGFYMLIVSLSLPVTLLFWATANRVLRSVCWSSRQRTTCSAVKG